MQNHDVISLLESTFTLPGILPRLKQEAFDTKTIEESSPPGRQQNSVINNLYKIVISSIFYVIYARCSFA